MRLYSGTSKQFIEDTVQNRIADRLRSSFELYYRYEPGPQEVVSWRNSLRAMCLVIEHARLLDNGIILEYQLPLTSRRLDCLICGKDAQREDNAAIIELKQWDKCEVSDSEGSVMTWVGGAQREVLHPSVQVGQYALYLQDYHAAFYDQNPIKLAACSYLHNYRRDHHDPIFEPELTQTLTDYPIFTSQDVSQLQEFLSMRLSGGKGQQVLHRVEESTVRPSKKLMDHVAQMIRGRKEYVLLDEQMIVYQRVLAATHGSHARTKTVILVRGGPGTGKSVIAINLMADLLMRDLEVHYATGSRAFTSTLRDIIGVRGSAQFKYFNSYVDAKPNTIDVLIADEAHRIRTSSSTRFTPRANKSTKSQIEELIDAAKASVFFIDDRQIVRPGEVGSSNLILAAAKKRRCSIFEYKLEAQFRCSGSDAFVNWVNNTLGIERTANILWTGEEKFEFKIFDGPSSLEKAIRGHAKSGSSARLVAGFCWSWSDPRRDGTLVDDVAIGSWKHPWNAKPEATHLAKGIPKAVLWAHDPAGIEQVGCVYTAQGFEFDYVGVIIGRDLRFDFRKKVWRGYPEESHDSVVKRSGDRFTDLVKNTYRVLLSRGLKGCYVTFLDKDTEKFFRSRMEK
ncbi:MAG: DUF2075 domain-containing protein [Bacteroidota bacterium]